MDTARIHRTLPAIRKRDSDMEAQDLYSKFFRYKLEMFNFPNHPDNFGIYQMQSYFEMITNNTGLKPLNIYRKIL